MVFSLFSDEVTAEKKAAISKKLLTAPRSQTPDEPLLVLDESTELVDLVDGTS